MFALHSLDPREGGVEGGGGGRGVIGGGREEVCVCWCRVEMTGCKHTRCLSATRCESKRGRGGVVVGGL